MKIPIIALLFILSSNLAFSQTERIANLLKLVAQGQTEEVSKSMPRLIAEYPNEPGVMLLQAVLLEDGIKANSIYRNIVTKFPNSEWADDAQWRIVQFYAIIADTANAKKELDFFRKRYPKSEFLAPATDVVSSAIGSAKFDFKSRIDEINKTTPKPQITEDTRFGLQVGVYSTRAAADSERKRFMQMKLRTEVIEKKMNENIMFAVVIGNYSTLESAESAKKEVEKKCNCTPMVYRKD